MDSRTGKWVKMRLVSSLLLVSIGLIPGKAYQSVAAKEISVETPVGSAAILNNAQPVSALNPEAEAELLERTVQIKIYTSLPAAELIRIQPKSDPKRYLLSTGLGSLVVWQGKYVVVTHNHWGNVLQTAEYVEIQNWQGKPLRTMAMDKFMSLILYRDPGTLVLYDPTATWVSAGHLAEDQRSAIGKIVTIAHQDPVNRGEVALMQAKVVENHQNNGLSVIGVKVLGNGIIIGGDSGGGVWLEGELIGNTWAIEYDGDEASPSDSGLIAQLPKISIDQQDEVTSVPMAPIPNSTEPQMW